jgi:predicted component of type VI protein secretion system
MNFENSYNDNQNCIETKNVGILGTSRLGNDMVCGNYVNGFIYKVIFNIGPIKNTEIREFLPDRSVGRLLKCFCSYFVPMELDIETNFISDAHENPFIISDHKLDSHGLLGYNTILN